MTEMPVTHRTSGRSSQKVKVGLSRRDVCAESCEVDKRSYLGGERTEKPAYEKYGALDIQNSFKELLIVFRAH